jgi:hypothetical protein
MSTNLTLEAELERRASHERDQDAIDLWGRYISVKNYLTTEYYRWMQNNNPFLTDHGEQHIRSVIQACGMLLDRHLDPDISPGKRQLTTLDIFLVLSAILWHDVGNVYKREGHAQRAVEMTNQIKTLGFPEPEIHRLVTQIALAHSGRDGLSKASQEQDCSTFHNTYTVYPRALAAIVRFGDEVSENRFRVSAALLPDVPPANRVFWEYANTITASRPEPSRKRIVVTISIQREAAVQEYDCVEFPNRCNSEGRIHLLDYVICRLEKMNNERAYCSPQFIRYATIEEIEARMTILDGMVPVREDAVHFRDAGVHNNYPQIPIFDNFYRSHPDWRPEKLKEEVSR